MSLGGGFHNSFVERLASMITGRFETKVEEKKRDDKADSENENDNYSDDENIESITVNDCVVEDSDNGTGRNSAKDFQMEEGCRVPRNGTTPSMESELELELEAELSGVVSIPTKFAEYLSCKKAEKLRFEELTRDFRLRELIVGYEEILELIKKADDRHDLALRRAIVGARGRRGSVISQGRIEKRIKVQDQQQSSVPANLRKVMVLDKKYQTLVIEHELSLDEIGHLKAENERLRRMVEDGEVPRSAGSQGSQQTPRIGRKLVSTHF